MSRTSDVDQLHDRDGAANVGYVGLQSQHVGQLLEGGFGPNTLIKWLRWVGMPAAVPWSFQSPRTKPLARQWRM
ncbi:hypothetical protein [Ruegeria marisrubri]|uniref:hypothetical protein n=1 Tax=Ruegeria marisrubri TaxID=1685379 RepID=UPI0012FD4331|nr:hypothetical protein [Ruegeria marisrubri]